MLGPRGEHQQQLGIGGHRLVAGRQQQLTDALGERRAARLAGQLHLDAALAPALGQVVAVGALAGPFRALQGDEQAGHTALLILAAPLIVAAG